MNKTNLPLKNIVLLLLCITLNACTPPRPTTPYAVAQAFWNAALQGDNQTALQYLTPQSRQNFKLVLQSPMDRVELGEQVIQAHRAEILTRLIHQPSAQNPEKYIALRTVLVFQNQQWWVDYQQTRKTMLNDEFQQALEQFSHSMNQVVNKSMRLMNDSLQKELQHIERSMQQLNRQLDRELQKQHRKATPNNPPTTL